ncbi:MAG: aldo/keto reductase [Oscillospiraceae bacterium]|nr:aldo/keto reductase [Oscillospiraceae bacterium]MBR6696568.1 aldo/keto reductase [Oscillospiraceae bacterium]
MIYRDFCGKKLSALGMGCMRLPVTDEKNSSIDKSATREMIDYAIKNGVNYFDTAWGYHDGESENIVGEILSEYPRDSFYIATKFPGYDVSNMTKVEEIFEEQLKKCRVDYFDFYMFHNVCESNIEEYLDRQYGIYDYLMKQKENGRIRHLGFSTHGTLDTMKRFIDAYGKDMEFCQIQLNWIDWKMQNAKAKVEMLKEQGIPVWVMEPVRGGKLATLEEEYANELKTLRPDATPAEWSFRFLQSIPEVVVTLSGMSDMKQLIENIATYGEEKPLSEKETEKLFSVADAMTSKTTLPCTACRYCTTHCPMELDIPNLIDLYNEHVYSGGGFLAPMAIGSLPDDKKPSACLSCRACEAVCPQNIKISEMMSDFVEKLK